jgi:ferredoxin
LSAFPWSAQSSVRRLYGLLEVTVCWVGAAAAVLWPTVGAVLFGVCAVTSVTLFSLLRGFEERQRTACAACGTKVHRCAQHCPSCAAERVPSRLGMFGRALEKQVEELATHRLQLLGVLRCSRCAEPLLQGASGACRRCATPVFPDTAALKRFVSYADKRWWALVPVLALLGTVPVLGAIIGLWLYRLSPAGSLGAFARWRNRVSVKLLMDLALQGLAVLQPLPLVGAAILPALVGLLHAQNRRAVLARTEALPAVNEGSIQPLDAQLLTPGRLP